MRLKKDSGKKGKKGKKDKIEIEHIDLDNLNLIVDGEKLTEARAAIMGAELAKKAHQILGLTELK